MNLHHLKHFIAVAELLHFGRAAERLGMSQPPLSQSIGRLEKLLGCQLFYRSRRRVELSPAGEMLLGHARDILAKLDAAETAARLANDAGVNRLSIGFTPNSLSECLPAALRALKALAPSIELQLREAGRTEQVRRLLAGELDIGFFIPQDTEVPGLEMHVVERGALVAAIPSDWPLARKAELFLADLADQPMLLFPADLRPGLHATILTTLRQAGITPNIAQEASFDITRMKLAAAGLGLALVNARAAPRGFPGVELRRISDLPATLSFDLAMAWRRGAAPGTRRIILAAYDSVKARPGWEPGQPA